MSEPHLPFVAELDKDVFIKDAQEALELLVNYKYQGTDYMLVHSNNLPVDFFDQQVWPEKFFRNFRIMTVIWESLQEKLILRVRA